MSNPDTPKTCEICGQSPVGEACYHLCPNSIYYYSPEQELADEATFGQDGGYEDWMARRDAEMEAETEAYYADLEAETSLIAMERDPEPWEIHEAQQAARADEWATAVAEDDDIIPF